MGNVGIALDQPEAFLRANPCIDLAVHNEGEQTFLGVIEQFPKRAWDQLAGVSFVRPDGTLYYAAVQTMPFARPHFDELLAAVDAATGETRWRVERPAAANWSRAVRMCR